MLITLLHVLFHCTAALPQLKIAFSLHYYDDCTKGTATKSSFILWHNQIHFESPLFLSVSVQCTLVTLRAEYLIFFCFQFSELFLSLPLSSSLQSHLHVSISQANNATIKPVNDVKTILYHHQHHHLIKVSPSPSLHNQNFSRYTIENASNILLQLCGGHLRWILSTFNINILTLENRHSPMSLYMV